MSALDVLDSVASVSGVAAGLLAILYTSRVDKRARQEDRQADRDDSRAEWERDNVTQQYLALQQAHHNVVLTYVSRVMPILIARPLGDMGEAFTLITEAHEQFRSQLRQTMMVARPHVFRLAKSLFDLRVDVLVPFARKDTGISSMPGSRAMREHHHWQELEDLLIFAARLDMGISTGAEAERFESELGRKLGDESTRSLLADYSPLQILQGFGVTGFHNYEVLPATVAVEVSSVTSVPRAVANHVVGYLKVEGETLSAALPDDLLEATRTLVLTKMARMLELNFRQGSVSLPTNTGGQLYCWYGDSAVQGLQ